LPGVGLGLNLAGRALHEAQNVRILAGSGMVAPMRPDKAARLAVAGARWGASPATGVIAGAIRHPDRTMLVDERGLLTYAEVDRRTNAVARALQGAGVQDGDRVGVMCRDHRGFVDAAVGAAKAGADVLLLNTSFAGPQLAEVARRENAAAIVYDEEFAALIAEAGEGRARFVGWHEGDTEDATLEDVIVTGDDSSVSPPGHTSHVTILTSGRPAPRRAPPARTCRARWTRRPRCSSASRCTRASARSWPRRCSTRGASPTSPWAWRWARRSCCAGASTRRRRWPTSPSTAARRWSSCP
jgi:fatty-acyl-CoA synthase